ncbi:MAG: site-2 protease family protein [Candidatus Uhrbacteria bacterium]
MRLTMTTAPAMVRLRPFPLPHKRKGGLVRKFALIIAILGVIVFLHECTHAVVGRAVGIGIEQFAVGIGPELMSTRVGDVAVSVRPIPLFGYATPKSRERAEHFPKDADTIAALPGAYMEDAPLATQLLFIGSASTANIAFGVLVITIFFVPRERRMRRRDARAPLHTAPSLPRYTVATLHLASMLLKLPITIFRDVVTGRIFKLLSERGNIASIIATTHTSEKRFGLGGGAITSLGVFSIAVGAFNIIPIPPLDGGEMVAAIVRGIVHDSPLRWFALDLYRTTGFVVMVSVLTYAVASDALIGFNCLLRAHQTKNHANSSTPSPPAS